MKFSRRSWSFWGEKPLSLYVVLYTIVSYLCIFYLLYLPIHCFMSGTEVVLYNIPSMIISVFLIYKMTRKELPYEETIELKRRVNWSIFILILTAIICLSLAKEQYTFDFAAISKAKIKCFSVVKNQYVHDYSRINFWKNIFYTTEYNNFFFFTYNILCSSVLAGLLTFNNINNVKEFYSRREIEGDAPWYTNLKIYISICIIAFLVFSQLKQITTNYLYLITIIYLSGFICSLICRMIICFGLFVRKIIIRLSNIISLFLKG